MAPRRSKAKVLTGDWGCQGQNPPCTIPAKVLDLAAPQEFYDDNMAGPAPRRREGGQAGGVNLRRVFHPDPR
jgi:hypothetical protein